MYRLLKFSFFILVCIVINTTIATNVARAQNVKRLEEEAIKDRERDVKRRQLLEQYKEQEQIIKNTPISEEEAEQRNLVEVESNNILPSDLANIYSLVPYKVRRRDWGHMFSVAYCQFSPTSYQTDYFGAGIPLASGESSSYENVFGSEAAIELSYGYKWNFILGAVTGEAGLALYSNAAEAPDLGDAQLSARIIRAGARYTMDNIYYEPLFAPYVYGGVYTVLYDETQGAESYNGNTGPAPYWGAGIKFQLSWLDKASAVEAYTESGIENTYLFAEVRQYMASTVEQDPDFSTGMDLNMGMSLEF